MGAINKKVNTFRLRNEAMKQNISITPGKIFSANCDYSRFIRISFGQPWSEDLDYGLMTLGKLIKKF
jgi:DNA-binding transcriptional MocR family regulator